jgi:hypothetical protein
MTTASATSAAARDDALSAASSGSEVIPRDYAVFGGVLRSDVELPELTPVTARVGSLPPDWVVRVARGDAPGSDAFTPVGHRQLGLEHYRLSRAPHCFRLEYSHAGVFDIARGGQEIVWYHRADVLMELVRAIILGPAIAIALEAAGFLCLHGSAVVIDGRAVAFIGPKHHGKSTLAAALVAAGARLIGDDLLAVAPGPPAVMRPGVPSLRLWKDSVSVLEAHDLSGTRLPGVKTTIVGLDEQLRSSQGANVAAVYLLAPIAPNANDCAAWRTPLSRSAATIALSQQAKLADGLIGLAAAGERLRAAGAVAGTVPVWTLCAVRDFARLDRLVERIIGWTFGDVGHRNHEEEYA